MFGAAPPLIKSNLLLPQQRHCSQAPAAHHLSIPLRIFQVKVGVFYLQRASLEWTDDKLIPTATHPGGDALYHQKQNYNSSSSAPQMSLSLFVTRFSLDEQSMPSPNTDTSYHQQQDFGPVMQASGSSKNAVLSPISLLDADLRINTETLRPTRPEGMLRPRRRTSPSRVEQMITDVENLYEFGVNLSIFPEDPSLHDSLRRMKGRFRSLVNLPASRGQRSADNDMYEGSLQDCDIDE
jgi:hypothetical protein